MSNGRFLKDLRKSLSKIVHIVAQLHDRDDALDLIVDFLTGKLFQLLVMILLKMEVWIDLPEFFADVFADRAG